MRTFAVGAVVAVGLLGGSLSGCGGTTDAGPPPSPSATPSTSPSASPSPTAPVMPDAARENTKAGAVAFVRHYVDLINHAQATGDTKALAAVEDRGCDSCRSGRRYLDSVYENGRITGGAWSLSTVLGTVRNPATDGYNVDVVVRFGPQVIHRKGKPDQRLRGGRLAMTVFTARLGHEWCVREWTRAQ